MAQRILVADDEADVLKLLVARLKARGYEVTGAHDGGEALALAKEKHPHLILLDHKMPVLEGIEVCRRIKADPDLQQIPVMIVTASFGALNATHFMEAGANEFLLKPYESAVLFEKVKVLLGQGTQGQEPADA